MSPHIELEKRLWEAADELRANSHLNSSQYSTPILGLIFLKFAEFKFTTATDTLQKKKSRQKDGGQASRRTTGKIDYQAQGVLYIPEKARFSYLLTIAEDKDIGKAINSAMKLIEEENEAVRGVLPKTYTAFENSTLVEVLKIFNSIPMDIEGDAFGRIYEYFLGEFAKEQGQGGGEFFTPTSIVKLIVEILEPYHGRILDPACGSGGMFVQSARFVEVHKKRAADEIIAVGFEKTSETVLLCKMNLAVHGLEGEIKQANSYYDEPVRATVGQFDFVMANPPFNVNNVNKENLKGDKRFPFGLPSTDNANYIWIQQFYSALHNKGRAGFVMSNAAADARGSELEIRKKLIESGDVDVIVSIGSNFFFTVTLPCTLWFFDRNKKKTLQKDTVLFIDARNTFTQIDRAHREFSPEQLEFLANIVRLYRGNEPEFRTADIPAGSGNAELPLGGSGGKTAERSSALHQHFPKLKYRDVAGLCKRISLKEIEKQGWSLNPGRYVGVTEKAEDEVDFSERLQELNSELEILNKKSHGLEKTIQDNISKLI
ncbi:MAG: class I SAM-dependent DNA methyltransferase [Bacteroidota bacterium]|nr:class I SAM-dependent DNA methyltransferase [Bacteroidota bacterium]